MEGSVSCLTSWTSLCLLLQRGTDSRNKTLCGEYPCYRSLSNRQGSTDDLYEERNLGPNPTVNHSQCQLLELNWQILLKTARSYKLLCCLLLKSPVVTGLPFNTQNHLHVLILLSLATRLEPATHFNKANSPLQGDKQSTKPNKLWHVSSCSEEEMFSFNLLQLLRLWCFCFNLYYTFLSLFVCVLLVQWNVPCTSRVSAVLSLFTLAWWNPFVTHWLKSPQMTYALGFRFHYIALKTSTLKENVLTWALELEEH